MFSPRVRAQLGLAATVAVLVAAMTILVEGRRPSSSHPAPQARIVQSPIVLSAPITLRQ